MGDSKTPGQERDMMYLAAIMELQEKYGMDADESYTTLELARELHIYDTMIYYNGVDEITVRESDGEFTIEVAR
jgi:hypothetical protein